MHIIEALNNLMPLGGWSYSDEGGVTIHEDGAGFGYTKPTQEQIDAELAKVEVNAPILAELNELDKKVVRALEDLIPESDTYNYAIVTRKKELRGSLV